MRKPLGFRLGKTAAIGRRQDERRDSMRGLTRLARSPEAMALAIVGAGLQAALPLFLAFAIAIANRAEATDAGGAAISSALCQHTPAPHDPPVQQQQHATCCILCQGLHAAGSLALPASVALLLPTSDTHSHANASQPVLFTRGSPAAYISRAPPSIV